MADPALRMSYSEYVAFEKKAEQKHEYLDGLVVAMAGGSLEHARLSARLINELTLKPGERPCVVYSSDARVRVEATRRATYPDVTVVCGETKSADDDPDGITNPIVIVEVLSESTEASDRGEKFAHYRRLPSLLEYVLVAQGTPRVEVFRRAEDMWTFREAGAGERIELASLGIELDVDAIYRDPRRG